MKAQLINTVQDGRKRKRPFPSIAENALFLQASALYLSSVWRVVNGRSVTEAVNTYIPSFHICRKKKQSVQGFNQPLNNFGNQSEAVFLTDPSHPTSPCLQWNKKNKKNNYSPCGHSCVNAMVQKSQRCLCSWCELHYVPVAHIIASVSFVATGICGRAAL